MGNSVQFLASVLPCNQEPYTPMQNGTIALWASTVTGGRAEETWPDTEPWPHMLWRTDLENGPRRLITDGRSDTVVFCVTCLYVYDATGVWPGMFLKLKLVNLFFFLKMFCLIEGVSSWEKRTAYLEEICGFGRWYEIYRKRKKNMFCLRVYHLKTYSIIWRCI